MINVSNEYEITIKESGRKQYAGAEIELADGTILTLDNSNIMKNGLQIKDGTSGTSSFDIGSAIINQCTLLIANFESQYSDYDFTDAVIRPSLGLQLSETIETVNKGVFTVDESKMVGSTIQIVAFDNMAKFEKPFSDVSVSFPITAFDLLYAICVHCGVSLATSSFLNDGFVISNAISDESTTCREIVAWIAQLSGNFARCNVNGALELKWYDVSVFETVSNLNGGIFDESTPYASGDSADGGNFSDYASGDTENGGTFVQAKEYHHLYALKQSDIATDDVVITGIQVKASGTETDYGETVLYGSTGYVIEISDNPLIQENTANTIASTVGAKIVGMRFRPMSISAFSDPTIEAGDVAYISDRKSKSYQTLITNLSYSIGNYSSISCDAETPAKNSSTRYSASTKAIVEARNNTEKQITAYDLAVQQLTNLMANSFGVFKTEEELEDGSKIFYMHNKPTLAESQTIWKMTADAFAVSTNGGATWNAGIDNEGNVVVNVLYAVGIVADWIRTGKLQSQNFVANTSGMRIDLDNGTMNSQNFKIDSSGNVSITGTVNATSGSFNGTVNATSGSFTGSINSANANITGGTININTASESYSAIELSYNNYQTEMQSGGFIARNLGLSRRASFSPTNIFITDDVDTTIIERNSVYTTGNCTVLGDFTVGPSGSKNKFVNTADFGDILQYCYETTSPMFGDVGGGVIGDDGICYINIDPVFAVTIQEKYHVFTQKYGEGEISKIIRHDTYFIVRGTSGLEFSWEVKAKQIGYANERMEKFKVNDDTTKKTNYEALAMAYLIEYEKELML